MDLGLKGRNAVVLGGTRGIGRAIAETLAGEGAGVAVCARNPEQVAATVAELKAKGVRATGAPLDLTDAAALKSWIADAAKELGSIDMLFSNAGAMAQGGDPASWEQNFRLDVLGAVNAFEAARPFLETAGEKNGDAGRHRQLLRPDQGGAGPHGQGAGAAARGQEDPRQRGVARYGLFQGRHLEHGRARHAQALPGRAGAQPDGTHGDAAGDRQFGGVSGKPCVVVHDRIESHRRWRDLEPGEFLRMRAVIRGSAQAELRCAIAHLRNHVTVGSADRWIRASRAPE
jgi:hypothetical protein